MAKDKVLVIVGPTASGKSDLAVHLAKKFGGEVISADSRQVYRGLDVGTGKITEQETKNIPHHMLDIANPKKQFSVSQYKNLAEKKLVNILRRKKLPIIAGGTGFYIDTLTNHTSLPEVPPDKELRKKLEKKSLQELFKILKKKDPKRAKVIDAKNKVRLIRALEIINSLGKVPPIEHSEAKYEFVYIGLKPSNLDERIRHRLNKRLNGIITEAKKLHSQGLSYKRMYELGLEYRYVSMYLEGKISKKDMTEKLYVEIKRYAKRQMTWFKRNKKIKWFESKNHREIDKHLTKII